MKDKASESLTELYFHQDDIEQRLGFRAAKFPDVNMIMAAILALLMLGLFYAVLYFLVPDSFLSIMFLRRISKIIPFFIAIFSCMCLAILFLKWAKLKTQQKAFRLAVFPDDPDTVLAEGNAQDYLNILRQGTDGPERFVLLCRVERALSSLHNIGRVSDAVSMLESQAATDEDELQSSYTLVSGLIWGIPVLGFIGTVLGLSVSMAEFGNVLTATGDMSALTDSLRNVTGGLSTAFETTLQGLIAALTIQLVVVNIRKREEALLDRCKEFCHKNIISRLRTTDMVEG